jgi:putative FmdB family regulatory protein
MPRYDYECPKCGTIKEIERSIKAPEKVVICNCGSKMNKLFGNVSITFKGDGWQTNDVKNK